MRANERGRRAATDRILSEAGIYDRRAVDIRKVRLTDECSWEYLNVEVMDHRIAQ
jgi:hypothetical protein